MENKRTHIMMGIIAEIVERPTTGTCAIAALAFSILYAYDKYQTQKTQKICHNVVQNTNNIPINHDVRVWAEAECVTSYQRVTRGTAYKHDIVQYMEKQIELKNFLLSCGNNKIHTNSFSCGDNEIHEGVVDEDTTCVAPFIRLSCTTPIDPPIDHWPIDH